MAKVKKVKRRAADGGTAEHKVAPADGAEDRAAVKNSELLRRVMAGLDFPGPSEASGSSKMPDVGARVPELLSALEQLQQRLGGLKTAADGALHRFGSSTTPRKGEEEPADVSDYVGMKVQVLLCYVVGLLYYAILKAKGTPVVDHPVILKLHWIRTLLEKVRPVDQRLQYQVTKLLQWAEKGGPSADAAESAADLSTLKPGTLATGVEDDDDEEGGEEAAPEPVDKVYRPPKISQVEYTGDHVSLQDRTERDLERKKARLDRSEFVRSLREEFTDAPAEVHGAPQSSKAEKARRILQERKEYEEDHMVRLRSGKDEKKNQRRMLRDGVKTAGGLSTLDDATADFRDLQRSMGSGMGGGGKGKKGKGSRGGSALQEYQDAASRVSDTRRSVAEAMGGGGKRKGGGKGSGKGGGGGKRQKR